MSSLQPGTSRSNVVCSCYTLVRLCGGLMEKREHTRLVTLIIMDGFGLAPPGPGNAILLAKTPPLDHYRSRYPHTELAASGLAVGLPPGEMGNSETGHM